MLKMKSYNFCQQCKVKHSRQKVNNILYYNNTKEVQYIIIKHQLQKVMMIDDYLGTVITVHHLAIQ